MAMDGIRGFSELEEEEEKDTRELVVDTDIIP